MPTVKVVLPPINKPIIDRKTGLCDPEWYRFFESARNRMGGDTDQVEGNSETITTKANSSLTIEVGLGLVGGGNLEGDTVTIDAKQDLGWTVGTGTPNKGAYVAYAGQAISALYTQAEVQALDNATRDNAARILAIEQALEANDGIAP